MREVIATGKTVEEATENACREIGLGRDEVSVEIIDMPVKKLFKTLPAKVKVTVAGAEDAAPQETAEPPKPTQAAQPEKPVEKPAPAAAASAQDEGGKKPEGKLLPQEPEEEIDLAANPQAKAAVDYLMEIVTAMGAAGDVQITALKQGDATLLRVNGEAINQKMDIKGETIQALSYLIDRAVNTGIDKKESNYMRIRLDIAGYRNRRESELLALAQRTGKEVAKTKRSKTLAPMNPYERLIVHTAISKIDGITSESIGSDVERRVVIKSLAPDATEGEDWRPPQKGRRDNRGGGRGGNRGGGRSGGDRGGRGGERRDNRGGGGRGGNRGGGGFQKTNTPEREFADKPRDLDSGPIVPEKREAISDGDSLPLYGKIEL